MHTVISPKILYFGTPVVLISTLNEDGSANLAPFSSAWWLESSCMLGISNRSKTAQNLNRDPQCVINLPSADLVDAVDRMALLTGSNPVPEYKARSGYRFEADKFGVAGLTPMPSDLVKAPRVAECPVQLEATVKETHPFDKGHLRAIELSVIRVHVDESLLLADKENHIDPDKWRPLIMNFCEFYGLTGKVHDSRLAKIF